MRRRTDSRCWWLSAGSLLFAALPAVSTLAAITEAAPAQKAPATGIARDTVLADAVPGAPTSPSRLQTLLFNDTSSRLSTVAGDFNHDGYPDLVLGAPTYGNGELQEGSVDIHYGSANGFATAPNFHFETNVVYGFIGSSPTVADVNGDGFADLIVGAYNYSQPGGEPYTGAVFVFFGSANGLAAQPSQVLYGLSGGASSYFGNSIRKLGDFNGDGYADIVVSAQSHSGRGALQVFVGSASGLVPTPQTVIWATPGETNFGGVIDAGDTNGDGIVDILVARPGIPSTLGAVRVYRGTAAGPATVPSETISGTAVGALFGSGLAYLGDVDGDGFGDMAVGAPAMPMDGISSGAITVYYGSAAGYGASLRNPLNLNGVSAQGFRGFGGRIVGGRDYNGDGYPDLIIGTSFHALPLLVSDPFPGQIWVLPGGPNGINPGRPLLQMLGAPGSWDAFGYGALEVADLNRDGRTDVLTAAPINRSGSATQRLRVYFGLDRR